MKLVVLERLWVLVRVVDFSPISHNAYVAFLTCFPKDILEIVGLENSRGATEKRGGSGVKPSWMVANCGSCAGNLSSPGF